MAIEDRTGVCATCDGRIYRRPNMIEGTPDKWFHREKADWIDNPHEPTPKESTP
jgi:hypothetical protein